MNKKSAKKEGRKGKGTMRDDVEREEEEEEKE